MLRKLFFVSAAPLLYAFVCTGALILSTGLASGSPADELSEAACLDAPGMEETSFDDQSLLQIHQSNAVGEKKNTGRESKLVLMDIDGLVYNHLQKTGGTFTKQALRHALDGAKIEDEYDAMTPEDKELRFTIGSVRNPCEVYVSLWAFHGLDLDHHARVPWMLKELVPEEYFPDKSHRHVKLNTTEDKERFAQFVRFVLEGKKIGLLTARFVVAYDFFGLPEKTRSVFKNGMRRESVLLSHKLSARDEEAILHTADGFDPSSVDCWIKTENLVDDLKTCLHLYEKSAGSSSLVKWSELDTAIKSARHNPSPHMPCKFYYDDALKQMVMNADKVFFEKFGYDTCCAPHKAI